MDGIDIGTTSEARQASVLLAAIEAMEATFAVAEALVAERRRIDLGGLEVSFSAVSTAISAPPKRTLSATDQNCSNSGMP